MTVIDIRIIFIGYVLSILLCTIVMTSLWWQNRKRSPEIIFWLADYILQFIALLLMTFRGILPDLATIVLANLFIIGGTVVLYIGLCRYVGKESRQWHNYVMMTFFTLVHLYLTYVYLDIELRVVNLSLALIYICAQGSWLMLRRVDADLRPATRAVGIVFAAFCLVSVLQIVVNLTIPKVNNIYVSGFFGVVAVLIYQILFVALTFSLFMMVSRRLSTALESELCQRMQAEWELKERFKELDCLYGISSIIETPGISVDEILKKAVMLLPPAMQFPEITEARITLEGQTFQTENFRETPWMQAHKIIVNGKPIGQVEVCYLEERLVSDGGPFLIEERHLLIALVERLGHVVERNMSEEQIHRNETRLKSLLNIMQHRTKTMQEFLDYALNEVIKLTDSKIGYIYFYHEDRRQFVLNTWSNDVMKECTVANPQTCYELDKTGVWGEAVRQRKPIILNDFKASHPLKRGYPEGHAHLTNFMTVPVFNDDQIVAVVGVANKASDYDETDVLQLNLFMEAVWKSVDIKKNEEKLRESEEKIYLLLNSVAEAIYGMDMNGNCTFCNNPCLRLLGYKYPEELLGKNMHWQIHSKHPDGTPFPIEECRIFQAFKKGESAHVDDEVLWRSDGTSFPAEYWSYPQRQSGVDIGAVVTFLDITERKLSESYREMNNEILQILSKPSSLHDSIQSVLTALKIRTGFDAVGIRLREGDDFPYFAQSGFSNDFLLTENTLIERSADGSLCRDEDGNVSLQCTCGLVISGKTDPANPLFTKGGSAWMNDSFPLLDLPPDQDPRLHPRNTCIHQGYASLALVPIRTKDQIIGLMQFNDRRKNRFSLTTIEQFEGIAANIGEALLRIQAEEQIKHMATHDLLTDLPSLRLAKDRLSSALNIARRYKKAAAVMFIDLDGFKTVNDTLGHDAGDYVLKEVAQRMISCVRETDTVARVGGDEFLIIATEINAPENASQIAEKVIQLVSRPVIFNGQQAIVGASIGIALFPGDSEDMDQLIKQADEAMYRVKNAGKNGFRFVNSALI